ncbi:uncharacterized protein LOC117640399 [Thrips palmi]|uniref:Uncharacterized protein LOC117640399 n=1 Tax=Thrips palmi TaxID=161013 RepID=A0A6P8ZI06_THRPL|nr:uncharacterized protein LOC117640399 [Thrips palmi]
MPVTPKHFYSRGDSAGSNSTEGRWPSPKFRSDKEVPPSLMSEPLSAPPSGFSQPKTTSSGLKPPVHRPTAKCIPTRFKACLMKMQDRWRHEDFPSAKQVLLSNRSSSDLTAAAALISLPTSMDDKCHAWVESISGLNQPSLGSAKASGRKIGLVDYSPSSNSTCSSSISKITDTGKNLTQLGNQPSAKQALLPKVVLSAAACIQSDCENRISKTIGESAPPLSSENSPLKSVVRSLSFDEGKECNRKSTKLALVDTSSKILPAPQAPRVGLPRPKANGSKVSTDSSEKSLPHPKSEKRNTCDLEGTFLPPKRFQVSANPSGNSPPHCLAPRVGLPRPKASTERSKVSTNSSENSPPHSAKRNACDSQGTPSPPKRIPTPAKPSENSPPHVIRNSCDSQGTVLPSTRAVLVNMGQLRPLPQSETGASRFNKPLPSTKTSTSNSASSQRHLRNRTSKVTYGLTPTSDDSSDDLFIGSDDDDPSWIVGNFGPNTDFTNCNGDDTDDNESSSGNEGTSEVPSHRGSAVDASFEEMPDEPSSPPPKITKKQLRAARKAKRNSGQAYVSGEGVSVSARQRKAVHKCKRLKCQNIITNEIGDAIFSEYWAMGSYEKRVNYICSRVQTERIQRSRKRWQASNRGKTYSNKYFFDIKGSRYQVCKSTFLDTLGETDTFVRICLKKKSETTTGIGPNERRGKQTPSHALAADVKQKVLDHIKSYPAYVSHYCRKQTKQKYLSCELTLKKMCNQFNEENRALKGAAPTAFPPPDRRF